MDNSQLTATYFDVVYTPDDNKITFDIDALTTINDYVEAHAEVVVYGLTIMTQTIRLCDLNYDTICPLTSGHIQVKSDYEVPSSIQANIPNIAYTIPDLDARVRVVVYATGDTNTPLACVEAQLTNGKTVQTKYAAWPIAAVSGLGLLTSGIVSIFGHSNTAAHIASNSVSLFIYFQSLAITAMLAVERVPPIAAAWAQNFMWTMGIIRVSFMQHIINWYVQATSGTVTSILRNRNIYSISVAKKFLKRDVIDDDSSLYSTNEKEADLSNKILVLRGIQRVAFLAGIEISNLFLTGIVFFLFVVIVLFLCLTSFKAIVELLVRTKAIRPGKFAEYRKQWNTITKGVLYRLALITLPQLSLLCLWELMQRDSTGCVVVAVVVFIVILVLLVQAVVRVLVVARKSIRMYKNPAYLLFGAAKTLNRYGFLYIQYRADKYYWVAVVLILTLARSIFIALMQRYGKAQALIVFIIEIAYTALVCWKRPFMDKRTNIFNIFIAVVNALNALFYLFFSQLFKQPDVVSSIMAVVYFVLNAIFALILLVFTIVTCVLSLLYKNPDTRYQPMKDDRVSFIPRTDSIEKNGDDMELMALGAAAMRGHDRDSMLVDQKKPIQSPFEETQDDLITGSSSGQKYEQIPSRSREASFSSSSGIVQPTSAVLGSDHRDTSYQGYSDRVRWG